MSSRSVTRALGAISAAGALVSGILIATTPPAPAGHPTPGSAWSTCLNGPAEPAGDLHPGRVGERRATRRPARGLLHGVAMGRPRRRAQHGRRIRAHAPDPRGLVHARRATSTGSARATAVPAVRTPSTGGTTSLTTSSGAHPRPVGSARRRLGVAAAHRPGGEHLRWRRPARELPRRGRAGTGRLEQRGRARTAPRQTCPRPCASRAGCTPSCVPAPRARPTTGSTSASRPIPERASTSAQVRSLDLATPAHQRVDCPASLGCESVPAPYEQYGDTTRRLRQPRPRGPAARPDDRLHRHPRHRGLPGTPRSSWSRTRRTSAGTTRCARPTATSPSTSTPGRRLARRQLVREHALDRRRARRLRRAGRDLVHRVALRELGGAGDATSPTSTPCRSTGRTSSATTRCPGSTRATSPACTGTRARTGTGSTTWHCSATRSARRARRTSSGQVVTVQARVRGQRAAGDRAATPTGTVPGRRARTSSTCTRARPRTRRW